MNTEILLGAISSFIGLAMILWMQVEIRRLKNRVDELEYEVGGLQLERED